MARLEEHQQVPFTPDERADLREVAHRHGVTPGIFARALYLYARGRIGADPQVEASVAAEGQASADRASSAAATAANKRWGGRP